MEQQQEDKEKLKASLRQARKANQDAREVFDRAEKNRVAANTKEQQIEVETEKKEMENQRTEQSKQEILENDQAQMQQMEQNSSGLQESFKEAMSYLGPNLVRFIVSGRNTPTAKAIFEESMAPEDVVEDKVKKYQQVQGLRDKYGRPLKFDPETGDWTDVEGNRVTKEFIDPVSQRKASSDAKKFRKDVLAYGKEANKDFQKLAEDSIKAIQAGKKAYKLIESNSKLAPSFAARALARLSGEQGRMTDQDVAAFQGDPSLLGKFNRTYERAVSGTMTAEDKKIMMDAIDRLSEVEAGFAKEMGSAVAKRMGTVKGALLNQEELEEYLLGGFDFGSKKKEQPANDDEEIQNIFKKYGL
jgi:hypothetical protein